LGGSCFFLAPLFLPAGALVSAIELEACDDDPALDVTFSLYRINAPGAGLDVLATGATAGTPGCSFALAVLPAPETIDNLNSSYAIQVGLTADPSTRFFAVRSTYRLQVSPAPAVASFTDVPTGHPYYRFVEALVDARITAGCGGGNYCVDAPITRGEMAVFLSTALGLHFAP
jgi:hypothetical protein